MKRLILIIFTIFLTVSLKAQSKGSLVFSDAQLKFHRMETAGTILTAVGGITVFTGNILAWKAYGNPDDENPGAKGRKYGELIFGGLGIMAVGIPMWAIGKSKLRRIEIEARLVNFRSFAAANGIGISIHF